MEEFSFDEFIADTPVVRRAISFRATELLPDLEDVTIVFYGEFTQETDLSSVLIKHGTFSAFITSKDIERASLMAGFAQFIPTAKNQCLRAIRFYSLILNALLTNPSAIRQFIMNCYKQCVSRKGKYRLYSPCKLVIESWNKLKSAITW